MKYNQVSPNPPHLIDSSGSLTPAALIPFCAYQTNMTLLGQTRSDFNFTVCSKFKPTVLEGQICFSLDVSQLKAVQSGEGKKNALLLLLDPIENEVDHGSTVPYQKGSDITSLDMDSDTADTADTARIYIHTLSPLKLCKERGYVLSNLKKMTGTSGFLSLPDVDKDCAIDPYEKCQTEKFMVEVQKQCGCLPWTLSGIVTLEVRFTHCPNDQVSD